MPFFFGGGAAAVDLASPSAIGSTTPNTGAFTTLSANNGTITTSSPALTLAQTWNASGTTFTALRVNATDTASASGSLLMDLQVGGSSKLSVRKDSAIVFGGSANTNVDTALLFPTAYGNTVKIYSDINNGIGIQSQGNTTFIGNSIKLEANTSMGYKWRSGAQIALSLNFDADNILAQRNSTNAQESRLYGTYTSSTNYQRMTVKSVKQTLSALSGASQTTTGTLIPDGAVVVGVTTRVATLLTGATGYTIGDGTDADRWGDITGTAVGTTSDNRDWTAGTIECFTNGGEITLTAKTSNFTAGAIEICVFYLAGEAD